MIKSEPRILPKANPVRRYAKNPIIRPEDIPFSCRGVYNSSAIEHDGRIYMVLRCEGYNLLDYFVVVSSPNGFDNWDVADAPIPMPDLPDFTIPKANYYDPRLTRIGDEIYMTFCVHNADARMALMKTRNMSDFEWLGFITGSGFRNTVLFPEKIDGTFAAFERPNTIGSIWMTFSPDLRYWGDQREVLTASKQAVGVWGREKIGPCGTPIRTNKGWLNVFHAVQTICDYSYIYHTGVFLTELDQPWKVIRVGSEPILSPEEPYELSGHAPTVVFASSQVVRDDGSVLLYYGAADRYQCVAESSVDELVHCALER